MGELFEQLDKIRLEHFKQSTPEEILRELLATIHRDGGHHTEKVGLEQSALDAEIKISNL